MRYIWCEVAIYSKISLGRGFKSEVMWLSQFLWSPFHPTNSSNPPFLGASSAPFAMEIQQKWKVIPQTY